MSLPPVDPQIPKVIIGLMSGTSMDGIDACCARLSFDSEGFHYEILGTARLPMPMATQAELTQLVSNPLVSLKTLCTLNVTLGSLFAQVAQQVMTTAGLTPIQVDAIGSHGQTIYHIPPQSPPKNPQEQGSTFQIGEPSVIAEETGILTIADFRPRDMAAGGQGAPLVCLADQWLFQHTSEGRCIQNIGGMANVTVLPAKNKPKKPLMAFDTGPGNVLIDSAMAHFFKQPMDKDGTQAQAGTVISPILDHLMTHPYLQQAPPKTTGREQFGTPFFQSLLAQFPGYSPQDWLATLTTYTANSILQAYDHFIFPAHDIHETILGGGGVYNPVITRLLEDGFQRLKPGFKLKTHADYGIPDQYKEALAFAILAWATLHQLPGNVPACTGARHPVVLGKIIPGKHK